MSSVPNHLPNLDEPYPVEQNKVNSYQRDGHVLLRHVARTQEIDAYRPLIERHVFGSDKAGVPLEQRDAYRRAFVQIANLWEIDKQVARFTCARRFARIAAELMGVDGVRLYHDQALFKEPGGGATFWHQDEYYWPLDTDNTITMWMPLVDVPEEMGILTFASGSHVDGPLCDRAISQDSNEALERIIQQRSFPIHRDPMRAGDATFHTGWTIHAAPANTTDAVREIMTIIYYADGARLIEPDNEHRPADLERWFPGRGPGDLADSKLNPLLYKAE